MNTNKHPHLKHCCIPAGIMIDSQRHVTITHTSELPTYNKKRASNFCNLFVTFYGMLDVLIVLIFSVVSVTCAAICAVKKTLRSFAHPST